MSEFNEAWRREKAVKTREGARSLDRAVRPESEKCKTSHGAHGGTEHTEK